MFCKNCGSAVDSSSSVCSKCGTLLNGAQNAVNISGNTQNAYSQAGTLNKPIKTTGFLVWSIAELLCLSPVTGLIAIILYCMQLKPAAAAGDMILVSKAKQALKVVLWTGIGVYVLAFIISFLFIIPVVTTVIAPSVNTTGDTFNNAQSSLNRLESIISEDNSDYFRSYDFE